MLVRRSTVEHPFVTIKAWMGRSHFLTRGLRNVGTGMALNVIGYNFKRMISLIGIAGLIHASRGDLTAPTPDSLSESPSASLSAKFKRWPENTARSL